MIPIRRGSGSPRSRISASSASSRMPWPGAFSGSPSGQTGRPPRLGSWLVMYTPSDGLPSMPMITTSSPRCTCTSIAPTTARAIPRQWRRKAVVSSWSLTIQKRLSPVNASSGHGICSMRQPCSRSCSTSGE